VGCPGSPDNGDGGTDGSANDASDAGGGDAAPIEGLCPVQHVEGNLTICDQLYSSAPLIRPPADTATTFYVGFKHVFPEGGADSFEMISRTQTWPEPTGFGTIIEGTSGDHPPYAYTLYRATVNQGTVSALEPVAKIGEPLFLQPFAGAVLEGALTPRVVATDGGVTFDWANKTIPVRIKLDSVVGSMDAGIFGYAPLGATIANVDGGVTSSDAACLPSLQSWGNANPLVTEPDMARLVFVREADMHGSHDDVIVLGWSEQALGTTMTASGFIAVPDLLLTTPLDLLAFGGGYTHGTPTGTPSASDFVTVTSGGAPCP
jgi:hypothetical protein